MNKLISTILAVLFFSACAGGEVLITTKIPRAQPVVKEVEIFDLQNDSPTLELTRSGTVFAANIAFVTPQIAGKITKIRAQTGQIVREGDLLITLGDSLSTDLLDLQLEIAQKNQNLSNNSEYYTQILGNEAVDSLQIGIEIAKDSYQNAQNAENNAKEVFEEQYETTEIEVDSAKKAYKAAKKAYKEAKEMQNNLEEGLEEFEKQLESIKDSEEKMKKIKSIKELKKLIEYLGSPSAKEIEQQLKNALKAANAQVDSLKLARDIAKNRYKQAKNALDQLDAGYQAQADQLEFAIETSYNQYLNSLNQIEITDASNQLQNLGAEQRSLQSESALEGAKLSQESKYIKAPITGKITDIAAEKGNLTAPGQVLITIEDDQQLIVKTSLSSEEASLVKVGEEAEVIMNGISAKAIISEISPSVNQITKKIQIEISITENSEIQNGNFVKIIFKPKNNRTIFVPLNSVYIKDNKKYVRVVNEKNTIEEVEIVEGKIVGNFIEIHSGLEGNEKVISFTTSLIEEGDEVEIKP